MGVWETCLAPGCPHPSPRPHQPSSPDPMAAVMMPPGCVPGGLYPRPGITPGLSGLEGHGVGRARALWTLGVPAGPRTEGRGPRCLKACIIYISMLKISGDYAFEASMLTPVGRFDILPNI